MEDNGIRVFPHTMCAGLYFLSCVFVRSYKQLRECSDKDKEGEKYIPHTGPQGQWGFCAVIVPHIGCLNCFSEACIYFKYKEQWMQKNI